MSIVSEIALAVLIIVSVTSLIWALQNALLLPVKCGKNTELCTLIKVRDDGENLEQTVKGLMWLKYNGKADMRLIIVDCGLSEAGRKTAEIITQKEGEIGLCSQSQLDNLL